MTTPLIPLEIHDLIPECEKHTLFLHGNDTTVAVVFDEKGDIASLPNPPAGFAAESGALMYTGWVTNTETGDRERCVVCIEAAGYDIQFWLYRANVGTISMGQTLEVEDLVRADISALQELVGAL